MRAEKNQQNEINPNQQKMIASSDIVLNISGCGVITQAVTNKKKSCGIAHLAMCRHARTSGDNSATVTTLPDNWHIFSTCSYTWAAAS